MDGIGHPRTDTRAPSTADAEGEAVSLQDAKRLVAGAAEDDATAAQARIRYRSDGIMPLEPDAGIGPLLGDTELPLAVRRSAVLDRREPRQGDQAAGIAGDLYVTSRRLILVGRRTLTLDLADIVDAVISDERLQLVMRDGACVTLGVDQPRLLRVQISAARAAARM